MQFNTERHICDSYFGNITLTDEQLRALSNVLTYNVSIITGAAGTGKTTVLTAIITHLIKNNKKVFILAYTGKAVQRVKNILNEFSSKKNFS